MVTDFTRYEKKMYSQNGEDGVINKIFQQIGVVNKIAVEIGSGCGTECNTRHLKDNHNWDVIQLEADPRYLVAGITHAHITAENVNTTLTNLGVVGTFDLLSIDIDGNDYWVWKALNKFPRLVVIEYNASLPPEELLTIPYNPHFQWKNTNFYGASLGALVHLGRQKGYTLVHCESNGINAFFVKDFELTWAPPAWLGLYRAWPDGFQWPQDDRQFIQVGDKLCNQD